MISIWLDEEKYVTEVTPLIKSFFPKEETEVHIGAANELFTRIGKHIIVRIKDMDEVSVVYKDMDREIRRTQKVTGLSYKDKKDTSVRTLYQVCKEVSGKDLPWGILTGVRPTKQVLTGVLEGVDTKELRAYMMNHYLVSEEKWILSRQIAGVEKLILSEIDEKNGYSIYISIPFCPTTCLYCSFTSYPEGMWKERMDEYLDCLEKEIRYLKEAMPDKNPDTIYVGGGTPTTLSPAHLKRLMEVLKSCFDLEALKEFTVEAGRPDSVTREKLEVLRSYPVTRISINPQTMKQETLDLIGRRHTVEQTREAFLLARELGFDNINMDIIVGLPGETKEDVAHTLKEIAALSPDNLTVHSLAIKRTSRLGMNLKRYKDMDMENSTEIMDMVQECAYNMGMHPYYLYRQKNMAGNQENVGYAMPGKDGIYNVLIMEERQSILAVGAGAITKIVTNPGTLQERVENVKDIHTYLSRVDEMIARKKEALESVDFFGENR